MHQRPIAAKLITFRQATGNIAVKGGRKGNTMVTDIIITERTTTITELTTTIIVIIIIIIIAAIIA